MKIKTRLLIHSLIIVLASGLLMFAAIQFVQFSSHRAMQEIEAVTTDDGTIYYVPTGHQGPEPKKDTEPKGDLPEPFRRSYSDLIIAIIIALSAVALLAIFLSHSFLKHIKRPLALLTKGADRVRSGDYSTPITYTSRDEFLPVIANFNDMQTALHDKDQKAAAYETAKRTMVSGISHDLRTPLTVVKGNLKGIQDGIADTAAKRDEYIATAYTRVQDIENLTNKLFETFDYETGEIALHYTRTNLGTFISEIIAQNEAALSRSVTIKFTPPSSPLYAEIDQAEFKRVFDNLISNTIKYSDKKSPLIRITLTRSHHQIQITFADNGKGVAPENLPFIFDEFYKEDPSRSQDKSSSGLGLFIVKKIIECHGGTITAHNSHGLCFKITLKEAYA